MITATQIINTISGVLRELNYPVKEVDIEKEIPRPCLVVEAEGITDGNLTNSFYEETIGLVIYYFAQRREKGYAELLRCHDDLQKILREPLQVTDGFIVSIGDIEYDINKGDMALIAMFDIYTVQQPREPEGDIMEELELR